MTMGDQDDSDNVKRIPPDEYYAKSRDMEEYGLTVCLVYDRQPDGFTSLKVLLERSPDFQEHLLIPASYVKEHHGAKAPGLHLTLSDWKTNDNEDMQDALLLVKKYFDKPRVVHFSNVHVKGTIEFHHQDDEFYRVIRRVTDLYGDLKPKPGVWPHISLD